MASKNGYDDDSSNGNSPKGQPALKKQLYNDVDNAKISWFHIKAILISGVGFYTDAYDLFAINIVKPMLGIVYYPQLNGSLPVSSDLWISGAALAGTLLGQIFFGLMGDYMGRKSVYLVTLLIMITATIAQALSASTVNGVGMIAILTFWRFILGFGIGGDYPLSATITSEYSNSRWRGGFLAAVFSMQGLGILTAAVTGMIVTAAFKSSIEDTDITKLDFVWRIILGLGAVPACLTIYLRAMLPETPRFVAEVEGDEGLAARNFGGLSEDEKVKQDLQAAAQRASKKTEDRITAAKLHRYLTYPSILRNRNFWVLIGTCSTWFLLDIAFYSQNLFNSTLLSGIGFAPSIKLPQSTWYNLPKVKTDETYGTLKNSIEYGFYWTNKTTGTVTSIPASTSDFGGSLYVYNTPACTGKCASDVYDRVFKTCAGNALIAIMGTVPGYYVTVFLVDRIGRIPIQYLGFGMMTTVLIVIAAAYNPIQEASVWLFIVLYSLTFFFANFGPNSTTFITPVELFTTKYRSTLHGISAASGKAGAVVGSIGFGYAFVANSISISTILAILAATNFIGMIFTIFVPETNQLTLEDSALHSTSVFGKFLKKCGIEQVNPEVMEIEEEERRKAEENYKNGAVV